MERFTLPLRIRPGRIISMPIRNGPLLPICWSKSVRYGMNSSKDHRMIQKPFPFISKFPASNCNYLMQLQRSFSSQLEYSNNPERKQYNNNVSVSGNNAVSADDISISCDYVEAARQQNIKANLTSMRILVSAIVLGGCFLYLDYALWDVNSGIYRTMDILLPKILQWKLTEKFLDPEVAHEAVIWLASKGFWPIDYDKDDPVLAVTIGKGLRFTTPIGLAAGFDKQSTAAMSLLKSGFSFVEIGSVTPEPQSGNPKPRIFRLSADRAIINRCGFNSDGINVIKKRLEKMFIERKADRLTAQTNLGVNVGINKTTTDPIKDIQKGIHELGKFGEYVVINVSSPNTKGLRDMQHKSKFDELVVAAIEQLRLDKLDKSETSSSPLLFVKVSPDLSIEEKQDIASVVLKRGVDGLIVSNTTIQRPSSLKSQHKKESGGLSGRPLKDLSTSCVADFYRLTQGKIPIIASGGVENGKDAFDKIRAGASLVQIYSALIYRGPICARRIKDELLFVMNELGISDIESAIGMDHREKVVRKVKAPKFDS